MFTVPMLTPVTCGCVAGVVCPARMTTVLGEIVALEVSALTRVTVVLAGAATGKVTANAVDCPSPTDVLAGSPMAPATCTVTVAVASGIFGKPEA